MTKDETLNATELEIRTRAVIKDKAWKADGKDTSNDVCSWRLKLFVFPVPELNLPPALYYPLNTPYVCYVNYTCSLTWTKKDFSNDTETI